MHSFLVVPNSLAPLLGRDFLTKVRARIHFEPGGIRIMDGQGAPLHILTLSTHDKYRLFGKPENLQMPPNMTYWIDRCPSAWAELMGIGFAKHVTPIIVDLKATA